MPNLNKFLEQQFQKVPQHFLRRLVKRKLIEHGIEEEAVIDALTEHIISSDSEEDFHWEDDEDGPHKKVNIKFTQEDLDELERDIEVFLNKDLPKIVHDTVKDSAKSIVKSLERSWPETKVDERNEMRGFRDRLDLRWAAGLDPLRMMLIASREVGQEYADKLFRSKAKTGIITRQAIAMLHMRACQTTLEVLVLLENGLPDGAYARWRTLYEISVVAFVIDRFGDEIAARYFAHDVVSSRESVTNEFRHQGKAYKPEKLRADLRQLEENYQAAIAEYGKSFAGPYGWAAHNLGKKNPRFQDLEASIDWNALPPNYKWSSYKVHAGVAGTVRTLGSIGDQQVIHAGVTNAGLEMAAINAAFSLMQVTSLVFGKMNKFETQIKARSLVVLRDKVVRECRKAAKKLEEDELEFRGGFEI